MAQTILMTNLAQKQPILQLSQAKLEEQYCRLCFSSDDTEFKQIFSPFNPTQSIVEVIEDFAKVTISEEDQHSKLICSICLMKLTESENFKHLIINSDFKLQNQLITYEKLFKTDIDMIEGESDHEKVDVEDIDLKEDIINIGTELFNEINNLGDLKKEPVLNESGIAIAKNIKIEDYESCVSEKHNSGDKIEKKRIRRSYNLKCPECGRICKWHKDLKRHLITHTRNYPVHCSICKKGFARSDELKQHQLIHTGETKYQCEICGKGFKTRSNFLKHKLSHDGLKPFKCDLCPKKFVTKYTLGVHIENKHCLNEDDSNFSCDVCNKQYKTKGYLQSHMRRSHKPCELVTCNICGKVVRYYKVHMKLHLKPHKCNECDQSFGTLELLRGHSTIHTGQKLYECDICKKMFRFSGSLHTHRKTHDLTTRFKCEFCAKQFNYKQQWKLHLSKMHQQYNC